MRGKSKSDEALERRSQEAIKIGRESLDVILKSKQWCKHLECQMVSGGLLAELTNLPIGSHRVSCQYSNKGGLEGMNVPSIMTYFILNSCDGCPHHTPNGDDTWGRSIIQNSKNQKDATKEKEDEFINQMNSLRAEIRKVPKQAIENSPLDERQVLIYLEQLFSDNQKESDSACENLIQAAKIGDDLFSQIAINLLASQMKRPLHAIMCIRIAEELCRRRNDAHSIFLENAYSILVHGINVEATSGLVLVINSFERPMPESEISGLISGQYRMRHIGLHDEKEYPNSEKLLIKLYEKFPEIVVKVFKERILVLDKEERVNVSKTLFELQKANHQIGLDLLETLTNALELPDDQYNESADENIRKCIAKLLLIFPNEVCSHLESEFKNKRFAIQEQVLLIFEDLGRTLRYGENIVKDDKTYPLLLSRIANHGLEILKNEKLDLDLRTQACENLQLFLELMDSELKVKYFDLVFGYYALIAEQETPPEITKLWLPGEESESKELDAIEKSNKQMLWSNLKDKVADSISVVASSDKNALLSLVKIYSSLSSVQNKHLRISITSMLGKLGTKFEYLPLVMTPLQHALMDTESPLNRATAISSVEKIFRNSSDVIPENISDAIVLHLLDPYKIVHKTAVISLQQILWKLNETQRNEVFINCLNLVPYYKSEAHFIKELIEVLLLTGMKNKKMTSVTLNVIKDVFPTKDIYVDKEIAELLIRYWKGGDKTTDSFTLEILLHVIQHDSRDRYNSYENSSRSYLFEWIRKISFEVFTSNKDLIFHTSLKLAESDPWESSQLAALFNSFGEFELESLILGTASKSFHQNQKLGVESAEFEKMSLYAKVNSFVSQGANQEIKDTLTKIKGLKNG